MLGAIIGDIVGSRFEFDNVKKYKFQAVHKRMLVYRTTPFAR